jgi:hypothetical protein
MSPLLGHRPSLWISHTGQNPPSGPSADWWALTTANAAGTNGLTCLPKHGRARDNKLGHPSNDWTMLLNFRDRTPKRNDRGAIGIRSRNQWCVRNYFCYFFPESRCAGAGMLHCQKYRRSSRSVAPTYFCSAHCMFTKYNGDKGLFTCIVQIFRQLPFLLSCGFLSLAWWTAQRIKNQESKYFIQFRYAYKHIWTSGYNTKK